jgi:hypothetical protein
MCEIDWSAVVPVTHDLVLTCKSRGLRIENTQSREGNARRTGYAAITGKAEVKKRFGKHSGGRRIASARPQTAMAGLFILPWVGNS